MAHIQHPLAGDITYGGESGHGGMKRQALHAYHLAFLHPITGVPLDFVSALPADFSQALHHAGLQYNLPAALAAGDAGVPVP